MHNLNKENSIGYLLTRRNFIKISSASAISLFLGCATNPVTGKSQLMLVPEATEIQLDKKNSPHQFSADYGVLQDNLLNAYISQTGKNMVSRTHRPHMPYTFKGVNATYINAYAFPGGSIAVTRGMLLKLENEAELSALLGHELGHVNMRHTAEQMSKGMLTQALVVGASAYVGTKYSEYSELAMGLGMIGSGMLLAKYSRDNEREADALGMQYMVNSGYNPQGMVGLMDVLNNMSKHKANAAQVLFSTHPMSSERYDTAVYTAKIKYGHAKNLPVYKDRYMDHTKRLRSIKGAIEEMQKGDELMSKKNYSTAQTHYENALRKAPDDYAGLVKMSKCLLAQKKSSEALRYSEKAKKVYPQEAQAHHLSGFAKIQIKQFQSAYYDFNQCENLLPGNPNTTFLKGLSLEGMHNYKASALEYNRYLQQVQSGAWAQHSYRRLVKWGYLRP